MPNWKKHLSMARVQSTRAPLCIALLTTWTLLLYPGSSSARACEASKHIDEAQDFELNRDFEQALEATEAALQCAPTAEEVIEILLLRARVYRKTYRYREAVGEYQKLLQKNLGRRNRKNVLIWIKRYSRVTDLVVEVTPEADIYLGPATGRGRPVNLSRVILKCKGSKSCTMQLLRGQRYTVLVRKKGHEDHVERNIRAKNKARIQRTVTLQQQPSQLTIIPLLPEDATCSVNGKRLGTGKQTVSRPAGTYTVTVSKTGYNSETRQVTLALGQPREEEFKLSEAVQAKPTPVPPIESGIEKQKKPELVSEEKKKPPKKARLEPSGHQGGGSDDKVKVGGANKEKGEGQETETEKTKTKTKKKKKKKKNGGDSGEIEKVESIDDEPTVIGQDRVEEVPGPLRPLPRAEPGKGIESFVLLPVYCCETPPIIVPRWVRVIRYATEAGTVLGAAAAGVKFGQGDSRFGLRLTYGAATSVLLALWAANGYHAAPADGSLSAGRATSVVFAGTLAAALLGTATAQHLLQVDEPSSDSTTNRMGFAAGAFAAATAIGLWWLAPEPGASGRSRFPRVSMSLGSGNVSVVGLWRF